MLKVTEMLVFFLAVSLFNLSGETPNLLNELLKFTFKKISKNV